MAEPLRVKVLQEITEDFNNLHPWQKPGGDPKNGLNDTVGDLVIRYYPRLTAAGASGSLAIKQLSSLLQVSEKVVTHRVRSANLSKKADKMIQEIKEEVYGPKIPILKEIVDMTLEQVRDALVLLGQDQERKSKFSPRDIRDLASVGRELNELMRLEMGQSTQNINKVTSSTQNVHVLLEDLRKIDPIFEYPETIEMKKEDEE